MAAIPRSSKAVRTRLEFVLGLTVPLALCCARLGVSTPGGVGRCLDAVGPAQFRHVALLAPAAGAGAGVLLLCRFFAGLSAGAGYMQVALVTRDAHAPIVAVPDRVVAVARAQLSPCRSPGRRDPLPDSDPAVSRASHLRRIFQRAGRPLWTISSGSIRPEMVGWIYTGGVFSISAAACRDEPGGPHRGGRCSSLISVFAVDAGRCLCTFAPTPSPERSTAPASMRRIARTAGCCATSRTPRRDRARTRSMRSFRATPGSMAASRRSLTSSGSPTPSVWKKSCRSCPRLVAKIDSFYAGTLPGRGALSDRPRCPLRRLVHPRKQGH